MGEVAQRSEMSDGPMADMQAQTFNKPSTSKLRRSL
jgi:hypothetical protein